MKLPEYPRSGRAVAAWAKTVLDYLRSITVVSVRGGRVIRSTSGTTIVIPEKRTPRIPPHPWKVYPNGDDTLRVGPGLVRGVDNENVTAAEALPAYIHLKKLFAFDGDEDITVTGDGFIYGSIGLADGNAVSRFDLDPGSLEEDGISFPIGPNPNGTLTVGFGTSLPTTGTVFVFVIAEVSLDGNGVAVVDEQVLTDNPVCAAYGVAGPGSP